MARETQVTLIDDFDGTRGTDKNPVNTVVYAWQGQNYEIELSKKNADSLEALLVPFILKSRQITRLRASAVVTGDDQAAIRAWAKSAQDENGNPRFPDLAERGRLPQEVTEAYMKRNGETAVNTSEPAA